MVLKVLNYNIIYIKEMTIIKRILIFVIFVIISSYSFGQKVIQLTKQDGVYIIPCNINGIKRSFVFDTGASTVTISMQFANVLYRLGKLSDSDIKGYGSSKTASGHIIDNTIIVLKDIEIAGLHLRNVDAIIIDGQDVPLLLGMSAIQKIGKVTLLGDKLIIDTHLMTTTQLASSREKIKLHIENKRYTDALYLLKKIESQELLEDIDIFYFVLCYFFLNENNKLLIYCQSWMDSYKDTKSSHEADIYYFMGTAYKRLKSYYEADKWFAQAIKIEESRTNSTLKLSDYYNSKACNYLEANAYDFCVEAFDIAAQYRMRYLNVTANDLVTGNVNDERLGVILESISEIYAIYLSNKIKSERYCILSAMCGIQKAINTCEHFGWDYKPIHK